MRGVTMRKKAIVLLNICLFCIFFPLNVSAEDAVVDTDTTISENNPVGENNPVSENSPVNVVITAKDYVMDMGTTQTLTYTVTDTQDKPYKVSFKSSDPSIVGIVETETVVSLRALKLGKTTVSIIVTLDEDPTNPFIKDITVEVVSVPFTISFPQKEAYVIRGSSYKIKYQLTEGIGGSSTIVWSSSNPEIATVVNGKVTAHKSGRTRVKAQIGEESAEMAIIVTVPLQKIEFNPKSITLKVTEELKLPGLIFIPYDTTSSKKATYTVDDPSVVSLQKGVLTGLKEGKTTVIAKIRDITTTLTITVEEDVNISNVFSTELYIADKKDDTLTLKTKGLEDYKVGEIDFLFPIEEIVSFMDTKDNVVLDIVMDEMLVENQFEVMKEIMIPKDFLLLLGTQKLEIRLLDINHRVMASYAFNQRSKEPVNLIFNIKEIDANSSLSVHTKEQRAYALRFFTPFGFPANTVVSLDTTYFGDARSDYYFLYKVGKNGFDYTDQQKSPEEGYVNFDIDSNSYVVTFNMIGGTKSNIVVYGLIGVIVVILLIIGVTKAKRR